MEKEILQPTAVFLPGESQGQKSLVGCSPGGSQRVGHNWSDLAYTSIIKKKKSLTSEAIPWEKKKKTNK